MKKNLKLMCVALSLSATTMAQQATPAPVAVEQTTAKRGTKIVFPPNAKISKITFPPNCRSMTLLGTTEDGVVLQNEAGQNILIKSDNTVTILEVSSRHKPKIKLIKESTPIVYKLIGTTDDGTAVWAGPDGKGGCTLNMQTGKRVDYVGHVTLLR